MAQWSPGAVVTNRRHQSRPTLQISSRSPRGRDIFWHLEPMAMCWLRGKLTTGRQMCLKTSQTPWRSRQTYFKASRCGATAQLLHGEREQETGIVSQLCRKGLTGVVAISAGEVFNLALRADGSMVEWGAEEWGGTSGTSPDFPNALAISAGDYYTRNRPLYVGCGLDDDQTVKDKVDSGDSQGVFQQAFSSRHIRFECICAGAAI